MKKTIYLLPGVGCDETVFQHLELPGYEQVPIHWLPPKKNEPLKEYVKRLAPQIKKNTEPIFIGLSFGGIVAIELARLVKAYKVIIISSIKTHYERPYKMSLLYLLKFYRFFPAGLFAKYRFWLRWAVGDLNDAEQQLVRDMAERVDLRFNKWAVDQAIHWQNKEAPGNVVHIHGDSDNIFPHIYIKNYHRIQGGTHFMIVRHAKQISHIIMHELEKKLPLAEPKVMRTEKEKRRQKRGKRKSITRRLYAKMKRGITRRTLKRKKMRA